MRFRLLGAAACRLTAAALAAALLTAAALAGCAEPRLYDMAFIIFAVVDDGKPATLVDHFSYENVFFVSGKILSISESALYEHDLADKRLGLRLRVDDVIYSAVDLEPIIDVDVPLYDHMEQDSFRVGDSVALMFNKYEGRPSGYAFYVTQGKRLIPTLYSSSYSLFAGMTVNEAAKAVRRIRDGEEPHGGRGWRWYETELEDVINADGSLGIEGLKWGMDVEDFVTAPIWPHVGRSSGYHSALFDEGGKLAGIKFAVTAGYDKPDENEALRRRAEGAFSGKPGVKARVWEFENKYGTKLAGVEILRK